MKVSTRSAHDALDDAIGAKGLTDGRDYADFLAIQHSARAPLERWADEICPAGMVPPAQCPSIAEDLRALGRDAPAPVEFRAPYTADWRGLAWALAGSSLGNRAMLSRRRKIGAGGPQRFLSDPAMPAYFRDLLPVLAETVDARDEKAAIAAAEAVFQAFETALDARGQRLAA
ncbi:hypothetical protein [Qipengyuania spongiae]|uniref:Heme oxygenase n=1 Tax=Qipengyuania spongiae TaxID=2909673 RepID=A0ABY5T0R0_9SPHN|nr:hypothetical protein [Qipengyuania spongiae]UVI40363.1 hypothetical protein L1F33_05315 [Qipengyuania spongiae]